MKIDNTQHKSRYRLCGNKDKILDTWQMFIVC